MVLRKPDANGSHIWRGLAPNFRFVFAEQITFCVCRIAFGAKKAGAQNRASSPTARRTRFAMTFGQGQGLEPGKRTGANRVHLLIPDYRA